MKNKTLAVTASLWALAACAPQDGEPNEEAAADAGADAGDTAACPVLSSSDWQAWIDAEPGPLAEPQLIITGAVTLPTPGYEAGWRLSFADRAMPPGQHIDLILTPPDGMVTQVVTEMDVRYQGPAEYPEYRSIIVHCTEEILADISPVPIAQ